MEIIINQEFKDLIPPLEKEEKLELEKSLKSEGCREPIITWNNMIVDGHNRYDLCTKNNIQFKTIKKEFGSKKDVLYWIITNQLARRNLAVYDRTMLVLKREDIFKAKAKTNQATSGKGIYGGKPLSQISEKAVDRYKEIAKLAKTSHDTIAKVKYIKQNATQQQKKELSKQTTTINKIYTDIKKKKQREQIVMTAYAPQLNKKQKYNIIYADPPWNFWGGGWKNQSQHYKTMTLQEIKNLPVKKIADDNCILFLWVTFPILKEAFEVIESWGFKYSTCGFNWVKKTKKGNGWHFGCGYWTRANSELCLIATKGKIIRQDASISQIIDTPVEEHSKKPDIVREKIVKLIGDLPRIELFARQKKDGWDVFGNEIKKENENKTKRINQIP